MGRGLPLLLVWGLQCAVGLVFEGVAWGLGWWRFPAPGWIVLQAVLFWGLVMGLLTRWVAHRGALLRYSAGALLGGGFEAANALWLGWWTFPGDRVWGTALPCPGLLVLAGAWGLLPLLAPPVVGWLRRAPLP